MPEWSVTGPEEMIHLGVVEVFRKDGTSSFEKVLKISAAFEYHGIMYRNGWTALSPYELQEEVLEEIRKLRMEMQEIKKELRRKAYPVERISKSEQKARASQAASQSS